MVPECHLLVALGCKRQALVEPQGFGGRQTSQAVNAELLPCLHRQVVHLKDLLHRLAEVVVSEAQLEP